MMTAIAIAFSSGNTDIDKVLNALKNLLTVASIKFLHFEVSGHRVFNPIMNLSIKSMQSNINAAEA